MTTITDDADDYTPQGLWRVLEYYFQWLLSVIGDSAAVARMNFITRTERDDVLTWLRPVEALLRRLIFLAAVALPQLEARAPRAHVKRERRRRVIEHKPDEPQNWHVRFRIVDPPTRAASRKRRTSASPTLFSAWPLAERIEAALRAFNNRAPLARRLARLLRRRPALAENFAKPPKTADRPRHGDEALKHAAAHARSTWKNDSS